MSKTKHPPGWANPRAQPFVGSNIHYTRIHQLYGIKVGQWRARWNNGDLLDFPPIIQLQTMSGCNANCVFCPQQQIKDMFPEETISDELFEKIVAQCAEEPNFHGMGFVLQNEPMRDPKIFDHIRHFRNTVHTNAMTFMVTNGTLLIPENQEKLLECGIDAMHISCNGYGKEDFEAINEGKSWDEFKKNLESFLERDLARTAVMMSFVRSSLYREELDKAIAYWRERGFHCFVHGINNRGGLVEDYEKFEIKMESEPFGKRMQKHFMKWFIGCCPYPFIQMSVLASGKVLICTHDWSRKQIIGDLNEQTVREVWNGPVMKEIRMKLLSGRDNEVPSCECCDVYHNATFV